MINLLNLGLSIFSLLPVISILLIGYQLMRNGQGIKGKPSIAPIPFYMAKTIAGILFIFTLLFSLFPYLFRIIPLNLQTEIPDVQKLLALIFLFAGDSLLIPALYRMSIFTRIGIPTKPTILITTGAYSVSRNPMYTSFFCFSIACFLLCSNIILFALIILTLFLHHRIILNEEKFLKSTFPEEYSDYAERVHRYL